MGYAVRNTDEPSATSTYCRHKSQITRLFRHQVSTDTGSSSTTWQSTEHASVKCASNIQSLICAALHTQVLGNSKADCAQPSYRSLNKLRRAASPAHASSTALSVLVNVQVILKDNINRALTRAFHTHLHENTSRHMMLWNHLPGTTSPRT